MTTIKRGDWVRTIGEFPFEGTVIRVGPKVALVKGRFRTRRFPVEQLIVQHTIKAGEYLTLTDMNRKQEMENAK